MFGIPVIARCMKVLNPEPGVLINFCVFILIKLLLIHACLLYFLKLYSHKSTSVQDIQVNRLSSPN